MRVRPNYFNSNRHSQSLESYGEISCMEFRTLAHDRSTVSTFGYTTVCEKIDVSPWLRGAASECRPYRFATKRKEVCSLQVCVKA